MKWSWLSFFDCVAAGKTMKLTDLITPEELEATALTMKDMQGIEDAEPFEPYVLAMFTAMEEYAKRGGRDMLRGGRCGDYFAGYMLALRHINFALQRKERPS
jgi:hypothetical protein